MIGKSMALIAVAAASVNAHGYMQVPMARNVVQNVPDKMSLQGGGPPRVNAGSNGSIYQHGMCGNSPDTKQNWNAPGDEHVMTYKEGDVIDMTVVITAHHLGFFEAELCDRQNISEECFKAHPLLRPDCDDVNDEECHRVWKPLVNDKEEWYAWSVRGSGIKGNMKIIDTPSYNDNVEFSYQMKLPEGVTCSDCVLRWHWYTTNSCNPTSDGKTGHSEEFWNCADIRVENSANDAPNTKATDGEITDLINETPRDLFAEDLRDQHLWNKCPPVAAAPSVGHYNIAKWTGIGETFRCYGSASDCENTNPDPSPTPAPSTSTSTEAPAPTDAVNPFDGKTWADCNSFKNECQAACISRSGGVSTNQCWGEPEYTECKCSDEHVFVAGGYHGNIGTDGPGPAPSTSTEAPAPTDAVPCATVTSTYTNTVQVTETQTQTVTTTVASSSPTPTPTPVGQCGSCKGCWWTAVSNTVGCYPDWSEEQCTGYGDAYVFCA